LKAQFRIALRARFLVASATRRSGFEAGLEQ
jgi:hypothetical protein